MNMQNARYRPAPYTALVANLIFPLHERVKQHRSVAVRKQLEESQYWPEERLRELQKAFAAKNEGRAPSVEDIQREVDALMANAGHGLGGSFLAQDFSDILHVINTNITGTVHLVQHVGRGMVARAVNALA